MKRTIILLASISFTACSGCGMEELSLVEKKNDRGCADKPWYSTCQEWEDHGNGVLIQPVRRTCNVAKLLKWEREEGFKRCEKDEETGHYKYIEEDEESEEGLAVSSDEENKG